MVLAESLGSIGAGLHAGPAKAVVGLDINATHHRAARSGLVTGVATPVSLGRTIVCYEVVVSDEDGRRLCTSRITCLVRDAAPGAESGPPSDPAGRGHEGTAAQGATPASSSCPVSTLSGASFSRNGWSRPPGAR